MSTRDYRRMPITEFGEALRALREAYAEWSRSK